MTDSERITALEERVAYQDRTIEELNETILGLWKEIEGLKRQIGRLGDGIWYATAFGGH